MTFRHLEDHLKEKDIPSYFEFFDNLQEPTKTVFGYALDIAGYLDNQGLGEQYEVFGGYAVLSHLLQEYGLDVAKFWRGSVDIDMAGTQKTLNILRAGYDFHSDSLSQNVKNKRTLKLSLDNERECKIDFSMGDYVKKYGKYEKNYHLGIPFNVISPEDLIRGKIKVPISEEQHLGDILAMISVLEKRNYTPERVAKIFLGEDRKNFYERLKKGIKIFEKDRFGFFPSNNFLTELKHKVSDLIL